MKKVLLILVWIAAACPVWAQQTSSLRGTVLDAADNTPLVGAMIVINGGEKHGLANQRGLVTITGIPQGTATVEISYLGYETVTQTVEVGQSAINLGTIRLKETGQQIDAVTVTGQSNIAIIKGDTTQFSASAFKTNPDADAGDLISKLPGATVEDGSVTIQGETVQRVTVDGKQFFGDDVMSAMKNLPADAIESIQMFDDVSDEAKFVGFDDGTRQRTLNIVTKHKVNRSTTGRIEAGYGYELDKDMDGNYQDRYIVSGNVNTFTDKHRWSLNGTANNMNRANRGSGFQGGGGMGMRGGGLRTINSIGLNYSGTWTPQLKFNGSYSFNQNRSTTDKWSTEDYYSGDRFARDTTYSKSKTNAHQANIRMEYEGTKDRVFFRANGSYDKSDSHSFTEKRTWLDENAVLLNNPDIHRFGRDASNGTDYSFNGNLIWTHKLGEKAGRTFTVGLSGRLNDTDSDESTENTSTTETGTSETFIRSIADEKGYQIGGRLSYAEPLSARSRMMATYRISYNDSEKRIEAWDELTGELDMARSNTYSQNYLTHTGELGYSYNVEKFRLNGSVAYQSSERQRNQDFPETDEALLNRTFESWQPFLNMRYTVDKSKYMEFRYNGSASLPSLNNLQEVITQSGNSLSTGNPNLKQSYTHSFNLRYNTANVEKSTNFWSFVDARIVRDNVSYLTEYFDADTTLLVNGGYESLVQAGSQLRTPVNMDGAATIRSMAGYSFAFRPLGININLMGGYEYNRMPSYSYDKSTKENLLNYANTHGGNFRVGFVSNISENVDFDISSFTRLSYVHNSALENRRTWNENVTARLNVIFLKSVTWNTDFSWRYQHVMGDRGSTTNSYVWNMGVGYKFLRRKQAELRVTMYDLLDQSQKAPRTSYGDLAESTSWTRSMGRYIQATLSFRFNSMNRLSSSSRGSDSDSGERRMGPPMGGPPPGGGMRPRF